MNGALILFIKFCEWVLARNEQPAMNNELDRIRAFVDGLCPTDKLAFCAKVQGIQRKARTEAHHALGAVNYGKRYTSGERAQIIGLTAAGYSKHEIAGALGRTEIGSSQQRQKVLINLGENIKTLGNRFPLNNETAFEMLAPQHNNLAN